ncbi:MAG TPA: methionine--tRNA ligase [archaeon]|nr:methionine--tRNA ligase [archaeon]
METINFEDFKKIEIRIGKVVEASKVPGADKLLRILVDFGDEKRQILTAMAEHLTPEHFVGKQIPILVNIPVRKMRGFESQGMVVAADLDGKPVLLHPEKEVPNGTNVI